MPGPAQNLPAETTRIRGLLEACERQREVGEQLFFTWGHRNKLAYLLERDPVESCTYDRQRAYTRGGISLARSAKAILANRSARVQARMLATADRILDAAEPNLISIDQTEQRDGMGSDLSSEELQGAILLAKYLFVRPGLRRTWLADPARDLDALIQERIELLRGSLDEVPAHRRLRKRSHSKRLSSVERAGYEGELVGIELALDPRHKANSDTFGVGVYWSTDPLAWTAHFYDREHAGMVCDFRGGAAPTLRVIDLTANDTVEQLRTARVLVPDATSMRWTLDGYNNFVHPRAYDEATHGKFIVWRRGGDRIYLDRCGIDYSGDLCRDFLVSDLTCDQARALQQDQATLPNMQDYFRRTDPSSRALDELNDRCAGSWIDLYSFERLEDEKPDAGATVSRPTS
jgi:hypothetical protein